ncbi:MAG: RIP metalloprotease RseP [Chromatiales bacterium]|nr:RIP metalloprotease RseP [Chromatiales bacterium]
MDSLLFTIASFIVALAILIAVHEFGHFWVARKLGVKVLRFSIGFGKPLWRYREKRPSDETEYVVAAIPLGGYVKMLDEREGEVSEAELHRAFNRQSLPTRSAIVAAGPLFNFLFAIFAFWLIFQVGDTGTRAIVGEIKPSSIAESAGFQVGDSITHVGDRYAPTWETAVYALLFESGDDEPLAVRVTDAQGAEQTRMLPSEGLLKLIDEGNILGAMGLTPERPVAPPRLGRIVVGESADRAGLQRDDLVLSVDGKSVSSWTELVTYIRENPGKAVELEVERGGSLINSTLVIGKKKEADGEVVGRIGAGVSIPEGFYDDYRMEITLGPLEAIPASAVQTWDMSVFLVRMVGRMVTGKASIKNISGPISIAQTAGKSASFGFVHFVKFLALISISLGVLNLLPIPILDGGHLLFFLIEAIKGSELSEEAQIRGQKIGILLLLGLMALAFYVDISRLLG